MVKAPREVGFPGDRDMLWRRLDKDHSGTITLSEVAPKSADEVPAPAEALRSTWLFLANLTILSLNQ